MDRDPLADVHAGVPPREVLDDVQDAAGVYDRLLAQGRRLHFDTSGPRLRIEVQDLEGRVLHELYPAGVLAVAASAVI